MCTRNQARAGAAVELSLDQEFWGGEVTQEVCKARLQKMSDDPDVLDVILRRPVPAYINVRSLQLAIHPLRRGSGLRRAPNRKTPPRPGGGRELQAQRRRAPAQPFFNQFLKPRSKRIR